MSVQSTNISTPQATELDRLGNLHLYIERETVEDEMVESEALPSSLVTAFAEATGWELALVGDEVKIVDMSASWPAKTPTAHRGRCDRFAEELTKLL